MVRRNNKRSRDSVQNVRVMDPLAGLDGAKVDRQLSAVQNSGNLIRVLCSENNELVVSATANNAGNISWAQIRQFDDFVSMAQQFNTFRVKSIRYDVYDINPSLSNAATFGTYHDQYTTGTQPSFSFADVVDSVDAQIVPPGTGKASFTWVAHSTLEKGFVDCSPDPTSSGADFGGFRFFVFQGATAGAKYRVITKAVVEFRGRR
jgi:hypothetical protein